MAQTRAVALWAHLMTENPTAAFWRLFLAEAGR